MAPSRADQLWVSDLTSVATRQGWLYLAVILDFFSRLMVGWKLGETLEAGLVVSALQNALARREPPRGLIDLPFRFPAASTAARPSENR